MSSLETTCRFHSRPWSGKVFKRLFIEKLRFSLALLKWSLQAVEIHRQKKLAPISISSGNDAEFTGENKINQWQVIPANRLYT